MWYYVLLSVFLLSASQCSGNAVDCLEKEKSLGVLDFAKQSLKKVEDLLPECMSDSNSTNSTECGKKEKAIAFLQIAKDLITEAENNYPTCPDVKPPVLPTEKPMDCSDVLEQGHTNSGVYEVWPRGRLLNNTSIRVYCDMDTDGGGWTVVQRRDNVSVSQNFNQNWESYKKGFGDLKGEFWLGNKNIFVISNQGKYAVRFDLSDFEGNKRYAKYKHFWIENEEALYKLHASNYSGNAGDSLEYDSGNVFCTRDKQNNKIYDSVPCTTSRETGWWFQSCNKANINGQPRKDSAVSNAKNLYWKEWKVYQSLASADMKLRRI